MLKNVFVHKCVTCKPVVSNWKLEVFLLLPTSSHSHSYTDSLSGLRAISISLLVHNHFLLSQPLLPNLSPLLFSSILIPRFLSQGVNLVWWGSLRSGGEEGSQVMSGSREVQQIHNFIQKPPLIDQWSVILSLKIHVRQINNFRCICTVFTLYNNAYTFFFF